MKNLPIQQAIPSSQSQDSKSESSNTLINQITHPVSMNAHEELPNAHP